MYVYLGHHMSRVPTVREKSVKNEKNSRSGKSQGILSLEGVDRGGRGYGDGGCGIGGRGGGKWE